MAADLTPAMLIQCASLCRYIGNTGQVPLPVHEFDDDWSPVGESYRDWLPQSECIEIRDANPDTDEPGGIYLTATGNELAHG